MEHWKGITGPNILINLKEIYDTTKNLSYDENEILPETQDIINKLLEKEVL